MHTRKQRAIIIHCHIFKNAGTTFDWSLQRNFGDSFVDHRDDDAMRTGGQYLQSFLLEHPNVKALSSHWVQFPLPEIDECQILHALILRHPIDRAGSVYAFEKLQKAQTLGAQKAKELSFKEFVQWQLEMPFGNMNNFQLRFLLDKEVKLTKELTEENYGMALERINTCSLLGIVERYDESMVLFEKYLRPYHPGIELAYIQQNTTPDRDKNLQMRLEKIAEELGDDTYQKLLLRNKWDIKLYEAACTNLGERVTKTPDFKQLLSNFRKNCSGVQGKSLSGLLRKFTPLKK